MESTYCDTEDYIDPSVSSPDSIDILARLPHRLHRSTRRRIDGSETTKSTYSNSQTMDLRLSAECSDASPSSVATILTSAGSSCTDLWSASGFMEDEEHTGGHSRCESDYEEDDDEGMLMAPKIEPIDDDVNMADIREGPLAQTSPTVLQIKVKRPRGRPRKHPIPHFDASAKITKGRSKTGCITCRKRKKKCDEAKPKCMNCEKNAVICEGYNDKTIWKSGKERAEEAQTRRLSLPNITLQSVIHGVETQGDKMFFEHYIFRLSAIHTVEGPFKNAFKDMILPMAVQHLGLMHSILALSSKHIDYKSAYGIKFLEENPGVNVESLEQRSQYHHEEAMKVLCSSIDEQSKGGDQNMIISARYGQMLCLVLQTLSDPHPRGQHRVHLQGYQSLILHSPPEDGPFLEFIHEFFQYHIAADDLIFLPQGRARLGSVSDDWNLPATIIQPSAVRLLGVSDGLFVYMSKITNIRNAIRKNIEARLDPIVDYNALYRAAEIDAGIRMWSPAWPAGDPRDLAGLLYKQMMWVYLWRTIYPPNSKTWRPDARITRAVNDGVMLLGSFSPRDPAQTLILAPAFVLGCAAFEKEQRQPIRNAIAVVKAYREYRNTDTALEVLEEVWRLMDAKDERSWDWQGIAHRLDMDFLAT